jgi:hypothetical protein
MDRAMGACCLGFLKRALGKTFLCIIQESPAFRAKPSIPCMVVVAIDLYHGSDCSAFPCHSGMPSIHCCASCTRHSYSRSLLLQGSEEPYEYSMTEVAYSCNDLDQGCCYSGSWRIWSRRMDAITSTAPKICQGSIISPRNAKAMIPAMTGSRVAVMLARVERMILMPSL